LVADPKKNQKKFLLRPSATNVYISIENKTGKNVRINEILGQVCATTVVVDKHYVLHILRVCVCSLRYPACNANALYYIVICGLPASTIFIHIISQTTLFLICIYNGIKMYVFFLKLVSFLVLRRIEQDMIKKLH